MPFGEDLLGAVVVLVGFLETTAQEVSASLRKRGATSLVVGSAARAKLVATFLAVDVVLIGPAMDAEEGFDLARSVSETAATDGPAVLGIARESGEVDAEDDPTPPMTARELDAISESLVEAIAVRRLC